MSVGHTLLTAAEFCRLDLPYNAELIRGEILEMPPAGQAHGGVCGNIYFALRTWGTDRGYVATINDSGFITERNPDTVRGPDVGVILRSRLTGGALPAGPLEFPLELAVEIKSPSDRWSELRKKASEYLDAGVAEVWLVDTDERAVIVICDDRSPRRFEIGDEITSPRTLPGFAARVADFFLYV